MFEIVTGRSKHKNPCWTFGPPHFCLHFLGSNRPVTMIIITIKKFFVSVVSTEKYYPNLKILLSYWTILKREETACALLFINCGKIKKVLVTSWCNKRNIWSKKWNEQTKFREKNSRFVDSGFVDSGLVVDIWWTRYL